MSATKTYIVPVVHHIAFGCEVRVKAKSVAEAKRKAKSPSAEVDGGGYDWDRSNCYKVTRGTWAEVEVEEDAT